MGRPDDSHDFCNCTIFSPFDLFQQTGSYCSLQVLNHLHLFQTTLEHGGLSVLDPNKWPTDRCKSLCNVRESFSLPSWYTLMKWSLFRMRPTILNLFACQGLQSQIILCINYPEIIFRALSTAQPATSEVAVSILYGSPTRAQRWQSKQGCNQSSEG